MKIEIGTEKVKKKAQIIKEVVAEAGIFSIKKGWKAMVLLFLAIALIGAGTYLSVQPEWLVGQETYNQGVAAYNRFREAERHKSLRFNLAYKLFEKASLEEVTNPKLKSSIFYNLGTMLGQKASNEGLPILVRLELTIAAIDKLRQAISVYPGNESAKYNREFLINQLIELYKQAEEKYGKEAVEEKFGQKMPGQEQNTPSPGQEPGKGDSKDMGF